MPPSKSIETLLERALEARLPMLDHRHEAALRLFNGFFEGDKDLAIDLYARTVVIHNYARNPEDGFGLVEAACTHLQTALPWLGAVLVKTRHGRSMKEKRGQLILGADPDTEIREHEIRHAIDLTMNRDTSLYLDTRELRRWLIDNMRGKSVLNTFAYTGSLGVAARAGGAKQVLDLDLSARFLALGKRSCALNGFTVNESDFRPGNFFPLIAHLKREQTLFDCVLIDPPFFATSNRGTVDLNANSVRLINKVRPLVADGGYLVSVNNALFVSGVDYAGMLESLCGDGCLRIESLVPVPADFTGFPETIVRRPITDPAPFNHSTKIAVLRVRRKPARDAR